MRLELCGRGQSYARLFRYHIVASGRPGDVIDTLGHSSNQAQRCAKDVELNATAADQSFCVLKATRRPKPRTAAPDATRISLRGLWMGRLTKLTVLQEIIDLDQVFLHECCGTCAR